MNTANKYPLLGLALGLIVSMALTSPNAIAQEENETIKIKHKVIQLSQKNDLPTTIEIEQDGDVQIIEISAEELSDHSLIESKLANLDDETRAIVMQTITRSEKPFGPVHSIINSKSTISGDTVNEERNINKVKEIFVINDGDNVDFKGVLKGHHQAIIKLIEKGEFTREQLEDIQKALDAKY